MKTADGRLCELCKTDWARFRLIDRAAWPVGSEDGRCAAIENTTQCDKAFAAAARAGAANGMIAETLKSTRNELAIKGLADKDRRVSAAVVVGTGQHALVPEAVDLAAGCETVKGWRDAFFSEHFKAPGAPNDSEQSPDEAGNDGEGQALGEGKRPWARLDHSFILVVSERWTANNRQIQAKRTLFRNDLQKAKARLRPRLRPAFPGLLPTTAIHLYVRKNSGNLALSNPPAQSA